MSPGEYVFGVCCPAYTLVLTTSRGYLVRTLAPRHSFNAFLEGSGRIVHNQNLAKRQSVYKYAAMMRARRAYLRDTGHRSSGELVRERKGLLLLRHLACAQTDSSLERKTNENTRKFQTQEITKDQIYTGKRERPQRTKSESESEDGGRGICEGWSRLFADGEGQANFGERAGPETLAERRIPGCFIGNSLGASGRRATAFPSSRPSPFSELRTPADLGRVVNSRAQAQGFR